MNISKKKKLVLLAAGLGFVVNMNAQTNTFPTTGNVGIGTTNPGSSVEIKNNLSAYNSLLKLNSSGINSQAYFVRDVNAGYFWDYWNNNGNTDFTLKYDALNGDPYLAYNTNSLAIMKSGNIGIGTTSPIRKLDVAGITRTTHTEFYEDNVIYGFIGRGSTYTGGWAAIPDAMTISYESRDFAIGGWAKDGSGWKGASLYINSDNGNIGIGTVTPQANLHIGKQEAPANTAGQTTRLTLQPYGHTGGPWNFICRDIPGVAFLDIYYGTSQAITINSSSNVGIGTASPQNKLDVNGTIHAREVKVDLTGWSDFVFDPMYKLKPLTEVEHYIKTNGHLENIPSAEQVEHNGVNVGDMQAKLLQKLEELTLYSIEQEKKIVEQDKARVELKEKVEEQDKKLTDQAKQNAELKQEVEALKLLITQKLK